MKNTKILMFLVLALSLMLCSAMVAKAAPIGTAFTYQGFLTDAKSGSPKPADGLYDFQFLLYDDPNGGIQQGYTIDINDLDVIDGYFVTELDFGSGIFTGEARWLETVVRQGASSDPCDFVTLSPRQELTPTPYAIYAKTASGVPGGITGNGTASYIPKFTGANTLADSVIYENAGNIGIGTTNPATKLEVNGQIKITGGSPATGKVLTSDGDGVASWQQPPSCSCVPSGVIVMWSGSIVSIPSGWAICDANNGTPDLRDRFIVAASRDDEGLAKTTVSGTLTQIGGSTSHDHGGATGQESAGGWMFADGDHPWATAYPHTHPISSDGHLPPYYALAYIMRL